MNKPHVLVVGAGFAGLSAAVRIVELGGTVTLVEATRHGGGRARSFDDRSFGRPIDNGQHLMMGCYHHTRAFLRSLGTESSVDFQRDLTVPMLRPGGTASVLRCPSLPAPWHLGLGLLGMRGVGFRHKVAALRAGLLLSNEVRRPDDTETCDAWLRRMGQTPAIRAQFWEPLILATLNEDPLVASAAMLLAVLERGFLGTRDDSALGVPKRPLSELYVPQALARLESEGCEIVLGDPMRSIRVSGGKVTGIETRSGRTFDADRVVVAVPPHVLLDCLPDPWRRHPEFADVARLSYAPIVNLWAKVDRSPLEGRPFVGLVGSPIHWIFDRTTIEGEASGEVVLSCTISAAYGLVGDSSDALRDLLAAELRRFFPKTPVRIHAFKAVKEKRATISHAAGTYGLRPPVESPITGLLLAGDWVRTGIPATIESACQAGHEAATLALRPPASAWHEGRRRTLGVVS